MRYFEDINTTLTWYQNHVGAYDKAKWEQTVEERIINGINHIPTKSTKLASELIDLDLVQGSSFPKAKAKYGLFTVARHGLARLVFLPFYAGWWATISSTKLYFMFLVLYSVQFFNVGLYLTQPILPAINSTNITVTDSTTPSVSSNGNANANGNAGNEVTIQTTEIVAPMVLMIVLTILHSQIIATHASLYSKPKPSTSTGAGQEQTKKKKHSTSTTGSSSKYSGTRLMRRRSSNTTANVLVVSQSGNTPNGGSNGGGGGGQCTTSTNTNTITSRGTKRSRPRFPRRRSSALAASNNSPQRIQVPKRLSVNETQLDNALSGGGGGLRRRRRPGGAVNGSGRDGDDEDHHEEELDDLEDNAIESESISTGALAPGGGGFLSSLKNSPNSRTRTGDEKSSGGERDRDRKSPTHAHASRGKTESPADSGAEYFHRFPLVHDPIIKRHLAETLSTFDRDEAKTINPPLLTLNPTINSNPNLTLSPDALSGSICSSKSNAVSASNAKCTSAVSVIVNANGDGASCNGNGNGLNGNACAPQTQLHEGEGLSLDPSHSTFASICDVNEVAGNALEQPSCICTSPSTTPPKNGIRGDPRRRPRPRIQSEETSFSADEPPGAQRRRQNQKEGGTEEDEEDEDEDGNTSSEEHQQQLKKKKQDAHAHTQQTTPKAKEVDDDDEEDDDLENEDGGSRASPVDGDDDEVRSKSEWTAVTTNSEDEDYVAEEDNDNEGDSDHNLGTDAFFENHPFAWEFYSSSKMSPSCTSSDRVSCTIWEGQDTKKADLSVLDISATIIARVERARENSDYLYLGMFLSVVLAALPCLWRLNLDTIELDTTDFDLDRLYESAVSALATSCGIGWRSRAMIVISATERLCLSFFVFFILAVAEKTYKQRFLYSKLFSRITSTRKAKKSGIPHFRLNKVRNIKTWLSVRSYLQKRGPQRSVNIIVSSTFISVIILIFFLSVELLKDSSRMYYLYNIEVLVWSLFLGIYLLRFMTLGARISQKYRNLSVIITEQLNLYLKMEQKPHKKDELMVANNVLKLAAELLKELDDPFKISSFATNPYLYNITRIVILSAFSGVLSEMLGFKLKLYKIKLK